MSEPNYTKGPWKAYKVSDEKYLIAPKRLKKGGNVCIAVLECDCDSPDQNMEADARLIAAAPDLLKALIKLHGAFQEAIEVKANQGNWFHSKPMKQARKAIDLAEGIK